MWAFSLRIADRGLSLARTIILARVLAPRDFGLFGIALLFLSTVEALTQSGISAALVQRRGDVRPYLDTAWTLQICRGLLLAGLVVLGAPWVARFFTEPATVPLLRAVSLSIVFQSLSNVGAVLLQRELNFKRRFAHLASGTIADLVFSVIGAFVVRNAWALVGGLLARSAVQTLVSYRVHPYRPRVAFLPKHARELMTFGRWVFLSGLVSFLITQGDDLLVGKVLGAASLGLYQMAYRLANLPTTEVSHVIASVAFPAYAEIQGDPERLREGHRDLLGAVALAAFPMAVLTAFLAPEIVPLLLGDGWVGSIASLQILASYGVLRALGSTNGALLSGSGHPRADTVIGVAKLVMMAVLIYPLTIRWGIAGAAVATTLPSFLSQGLGFSRVAAVLECGIGQLVRPLLLPFLGSVAMAGCLWIIQTSFASPRIVVILGLSLGSGAYLLAMIWGCGRWIHLDPVRPILHRLKGRGER